MKNQLKNKLEIHMHANISSEENGNTKQKSNCLGCFNLCLFYLHVKQIQY